MASREIGFYLTDISGCFCSFLNERKACGSHKAEPFSLSSVIVRITQKCTECRNEITTRWMVDGVCVCVCVVILGLHWLDKGRCPCAKDHQ